MKKFWHSVPKWALPTLLAAALPIAAQSVVAQGGNGLDESVTYESNADGKWVGINPTVYDNREQLAGETYADLSEDYKGHRWDVVEGKGTSRDIFNGTALENFLDFPGCETGIHGDGTIFGLDGDNDLNDTAIIRHHITYDEPNVPPLAGEDYPPSYIGTLNIESNGQVDLMEKIEFRTSAKATNAGIFNIGTASEEQAALDNGAVYYALGEGLTNTGTLNVYNAGEFVATNVINDGSITVEGIEGDETFYLSLITVGIDYGMGVELQGGKMENNGSITVGSHGDVYVHDTFLNNKSGTLTVNEDGLFNAKEKIENYGTITLNGGERGGDIGESQGDWVGLVENHGAIAVGEGSSGFYATQVDNRGTITNEGSSAMLGGFHASEVNNFGTITNAGDFTAQTFNNNEGGTFTVNNIFEAQNLNNSGTVEVNNSRMEDSAYGFFEPIEITNYIGDKPGTLVLNDSDVLANKIDNGAGTIILNNSTISGAGVDPENVTGNGIILKDGHTIKVTGTSNKISGTVNAGNELNITGTGTTDSLDLADAALRFDDTKPTMVSITNSSVQVNEFNNGAGTIKLNNAELSGSEITLADDHKIEVTGNSTLGGTVKVESQLNITGTESTSFLTFNEDTNLTVSGTELAINIEGTQTDLSKSLGNSGVIANIIANEQTRVEGFGSVADNYVFNSDSWLRPGHSPGTFKGNNITFNGGSYLYLEIDFDEETWDKVLAQENINFKGNTTVYVTKYSGSEGDEVQNVDFFTAKGGSTSGAINVGGGTLSNATITSENNSVVITNGDATVTIKSVTSKTTGEDAVEFGTHTATDTAFGFETITATGAEDLENPSTPTELGPPPQPEAPVQGSSNYEILYNVVTDMHNTDLVNAVGGYAGSDLEKLEAAISQLDPVALSIGQVYTESAIYNFNRTTFDRVRLFADNGYAGTMRGQDSSDPCAPRDPYGLKGGRAARQMWFQGMGGLVNQDDADGIVGYDTNTYGYALGFDRKISRNTLVGFSFGNVFYDTTMNQGLGNANTKTYALSLYGGHKFGAWQLTGSAGYVMSDLSSNRIANLIGGWAKGERDADTYFGSFELARRFGNERGYLTPFLAYDFVNYNEDAFTETGGLMDMTIAERDSNAYIQTLGARLGTKYVNRRGWIINPGMTLGWIHDYGNGRVSTTGKFNDDTSGSAFTVIGTSRNKNRGLVGLSLDAELSQSLSIFGRYDGEFASRYNSQMFQLGLAAQF